MDQRAIVSIDVLESDVLELIHSEIENSVVLDEIPVGDIEKYLLEEKGIQTFTSKLQDLVDLNSSAGELSKKLAKYYVIHEEELSQLFKDIAQEKAKAEEELINLEYEGSQNP